MAREDRGTVYVGGDSRISMGGPALPKETSGGGSKGSGKKTKPGDVELPYGSGKTNTTPRA